MKTLITGVSTRAIAESAVKAGHNVFTIDYYGDSDQKGIIENYSLLRDFNLPFRAENLIKASDQFEFDSVVYISNFENYPELLETLSNRAMISGNTPDTIRKIRDWRHLREFMAVNNILFPETFLPGEDEREICPGAWLLKPTNSGGGSRIKFWEGERLENNQILQKYVEGIPASACFIADGHKGILIGISAQLIGIDWLGAHGFTWCGNILPLPLGSEESRCILDRMEKAVSLFSGDFHLKGACGIDFVIGRDKGGELTPYILEINPRYTASMELVEKAYGLNIYSLHMQALEGELPDFSLVAQHCAGYFAKGILFAENGIMIKSTCGWKDKGIRDIPFEGDEIGAGQPVCTILSEGISYKECESALFSMAETIKHEISDIIPIPAKGKVS